MDFEQLKKYVLEWARNRNLLVPGNARNQFIKTMEECGELGGALLRNDRLGIIDGIGDVLVTLIVLADNCELDITECLERAYDEIKDREGKTVNGVFVKNE